MTQRPTGVVTFLFTDIEGSTARWEADAEAMRTDLARHDDTLAAAIADVDGWQFKHTGDGVLAAFENPSAALEAATRAQRALDLPVRMGIATGPAEHRNDDYFGAVLNLAARVMSAGHGGQVLVAASTASLTPEADLLDLGEHHLRGISQPTRIFQLQGDDLHDDFPALSTASIGNLPLGQDRLVGREDDLAAVDAALRVDRVVTLTGVGGVGKTRLALGAAERLQPRYPDGVWFVELASVERDDSVVDVVAASTGISPNPGRDVRETLLEVFGARTALIVLDNCEHLVGAAADLVDDLVAQCPRVDVLATSREALMAAGERAWAVPSLGFDEGAASTSVELFVERARAVAPGWNPADELDDVAEICRQLEGIPLAIELAAARIRSLGAAEIRHRLADRFRLLSGGRRRALERHQTLRHAIQWSFDLLEPDERSVLLRLSTFANTFGLAAAEAICADDGVPAEDVVDHLDSLVRKSLLGVDRNHAEIRFRQLETVRQFAEELLVQSGRADEVRARHAQHFADESDAMFAVWMSPDQRFAFEWIDRELDNLRIAFSWSADSDDPDAAIRLAANVGDVARFRLRSEAYGWAARMVEVARARRSPRLVSILTWAASNAWGLGRYDEAERHAREAIELADDPAFESFAWAHVDLTVALSRSGRIDEALQVARRGSAHPADIDRMCAAFLPLFLAQLGRYDEADAMLDEVADRVIETGVPTSVMMLHWARALVVQETDRPAAIAEFEQALEVCRTAGITMFEVGVVGQLARLHAETGATDESLRLLDLMLTGAVESIDEGTLIENLESAASVLAAAGDTEPAALLIGWLRGRGPAARTVTLTAELRSELGEEEFDRIEAAGREMSRPEIIRLTAERVRTMLDAQG